MMDDDNRKLSEKDFINEGYAKNPLPLWLWFALLAIFACLVWGFTSWFQGLMEKDIKFKPFLEVTNREMSLFLWQNPSFMRSHSKTKTGYLTGFKYGDKDTLELSNTEDFVVAPPDLLFLYHTWKRLVGADYIARPIPRGEFVEFLNIVEEWQPKYWVKAPKPYIEFVESLSTSNIKDLQAISTTVFPIVVRQAFQGWKNYFREGESINQFQPTYADVQAFLADHPYYARNYWRNIQAMAGQHDLEILTLGKFEAADTIPSDQVPPFLKVALFNFERSKKGE